MKPATQVWVAATLLVGVALLVPSWANAATARHGRPAYLFVAPPRESAALGRATYGPIAAFLSRATGHRFVYRHPKSWLGYERWIWMDKGDLYFDGPHFAAWRMHHQQATLGPAVPQPQLWRLYTWRGNTAIHSLPDTYGLSLCAPPPPNFGALWVSTMYPNPARQPLFVDMHNWVKIYRAVLAHKCDVGLIPRLTLDKVDPHLRNVRILVRGPDDPNQSFTLSHTMPKPLQQRVIQALLSPAGQRAMAKLRARFADGRKLVSAAPASYADADKALDAFWGAAYGPVIAHLQALGEVERAERDDNGKPPRTARSAQSPVGME